MLQMFCSGAPKNSPLESQSTVRVMHDLESNMSALHICSGKLLHELESSQARLMLVVAVLRCLNHIEQAQTSVICEPNDGLYRHQYRAFAIFQQHQGCEQMHVAHFSRNEVGWIVKIRSVRLMPTSAC